MDRFGLPDEVSHADCLLAFPSRICDSPVGSSQSADARRGTPDRAGDWCPESREQAVQPRHRFLQEARRLQGAVDPRVCEGLRRGTIGGASPHQSNAPRARGHPEGDGRARLPVHGDGPDRDDDRRARAEAHEERPEDGLGQAGARAGRQAVLVRRGELAQLEGGPLPSGRTFSSTSSTTPSTSTG